MKNKTLSLFRERKQIVRRKETLAGLQLLSSTTFVKFTTCLKEKKNNKFQTKFAFAVTF